MPLSETVGHRQERSAVSKIRQAVVRGVRLLSKTRSRCKKVLRVYWKCNVVVTMYNKPSTGRVRAYSYKKPRSSLRGVRASSEE